MHAFLRLLAVLAACAATAVAEQQPGGTFRSEINFVEVTAIVTDDRGAFVDDLAREDFEIDEDGRPQEAAVFALIDLPLERPLVPAHASEPVEWDVRSAAPTFDGRIYVLVLDDLHTEFTRSQLVRDAATGFVNRYLGAGDLAAVVYTSGRQAAGQELTQSSRLLRAAVGRFQGRKLPSAGAERLAIHLRGEDVRQANESQPIRTIEGLQRGKSTRDPYDAERGMNARRTLTTVENVAAWLSDVQGRRKALLLFSEGLDYDVYEPFNRGAGDSLLQDARRAVAAAQRANVTVYGIDPRGLSQFGGFIDIHGYSDYPQLPYGTFRGFLRELLLSQESLISLAEQTGGLAIVNAGDVAGGLGRIVLDNTRYYLLGYYSDARRWSGRFLKIDVRVRRPGLQVRARRGYLPPDRRAAAAKTDAIGGDSPALATALSKPLPVGNLPLRVFAAPFKGVGQHASVLVALEIDGAGLTFEERDGRFNDTLEISIVAADERAKVHGGDRQKFDLQLLPDTHARISRTGVRLLSRLDLPPGRYQIRVGAHETVGGATAMVPYDLEVPDYSRTPFALSGVLVTSSEADSFATANPDPQLTDVLPASPVARRRFSAAETLTCFAEVYDSSGPAAREIAFALTVQDASDGRAIFAARDRRAIEASTRTASEGFRADIPLRDFKPGIYVLRVEASSSAREYAAQREVPFEVRGATVSSRYGRLQPAPVVERTFRTPDGTRAAPCVARRPGSCSRSAVRTADWTCPGRSCRSSPG